MIYGVLLISKVVDANDPKAFQRLGITAQDLPTEAERKAFQFIEEYSQQNRGQAPSYASLVAEVPEFADEYVPEVSDSYEYLVRKIKDEAAGRMVAELIPQLAEKYNAGAGGKELLEDLREGYEKAIIRTSVRESIGTDVKKDVDKFLAEYDRRKSGESFRVWKSKFSAIGEYVSSNLYTVFGKSGRGKSVIALEDAIHTAQQGANVLIWAQEMGWYEILVRLFVSISGDDGVASEMVNGVNMDVGFDSRDVRLGQLAPEYETAFRFFVETINDRLAGNIIIRAVDDEDFADRSLNELAKDIEQTKADYVVIDPFYYLHYEKNTSKTTGGDAANTSMRLRALAGRTSTVIIAITQADETSQEEDDDGNRELELPERKDVKKTKQLLEDAYLLIGVDTDYKQGRGIVGVFKGRDGGEGNVSDLIYLPQYGVVKEIELGENAVSQFNF